MAKRRTPAANTATIEDPQRAGRPSPARQPGRAIEVYRPDGAPAPPPPPPEASAETPPAPARKPLLTLDKLVPPREPVMILGTLYEIVSIDEFSSYHRNRLFNAWHKVGELLGRVDDDEELSAAEQALLEESYVRVIQAAVPGVSREEIAELLPKQRDELITHFFSLTAEAAKAEAEAAARSIGESTSPASNGSTAPATPPPGSTSTPTS